MTDTYIPYARQTILEEDLSIVQEVLQSNFLTRGPKVAAFEEAVAEYCGASYAVAFSHGTAALSGACFAAKIQANDRVITSPNTFIGTVVSAVQHRVAIDFIDIDPSTGNMDIDLAGEALQARLSRGKKILLPVHYAGIPIDMCRLEGHIKDHETIIIEDACPAFGASYPSGQKVGSCEWSDMTCFSFHPAKSLTMGEGGVVTTNDEEHYENLKLFRNNGIQRHPEIPGFYEVMAITGNYNVSELSAALGLAQLKHIDTFLEKRRKLVTHYRKCLQNAKYISVFPEELDALSAHNLFFVHLDLDTCKQTKAELMQKLHEVGIGTQVHYIPLYEHPALQGYAPVQPLEGMQAFYKGALSLPLYCDLTLKQVERVCEDLKALVRVRKR